MAKKPYKITGGGSVVRVSDGTCLSNDPKNSDVAAYLEWVKAGGVPDKDPPSPPFAPSK